MLLAETHACELFRTISELHNDHICDFLPALAHMSSLRAICEIAASLIIHCREVGAPDIFSRAKVECVPERLAATLNRCGQPQPLAPSVQDNVELTQRFTFSCDSKHCVPRQTAHPLTWLFCLFWRHAWIRTPGHGHTSYHNVDRLAHIAYQSQPSSGTNLLAKLYVQSLTQ